MNDYQKAAYTKKGFERMARIAASSESGMVWNGKRYLTTEECKERANKWAKIVDEYEQSFTKYDQKIA